jgi:hypothetical protein
MYMKTSFGVPKNPSATALIPVPACLFVIRQHKSVENFGELTQIRNAPPAIVGIMIWSNVNKGQQSSNPIEPVQLLNGLSVSIMRACGVTGLLLIMKHEESMRTSVLSSIHASILHR